jgi:hypothetical protein
MRAVGIIVTGLVLFVVWMLIFGPAAENEKRDHRPPSIGARP